MLVKRRLDDICSIIFYQGFKVKEKQTQLDFLHDERVKKGENKYSTLRKVRICLYMYNDEVRIEDRWYSYQ